MAETARRPTRTSGQTAAWVLAAAVVAAVTAGLLAMTPAIEGDHQWAILASEQTLIGRSTSVRQIVVADPQDLGRDRIQRIRWSAPGHQEVVYALRRLGLPLGGSIKTSVLLAWLVGIAAWSTYFALTLTNRRLLPWLILAFGALRMSHYNGFVYVGGDMLEWAVFPLAAVANIVAANAPSGSWRLAAIGGVLTSTLVIFKYSAIFLVLAAAVFWAWTVCLDRRRLTAAVGWTAGAAAGALLALVCGVGQLTSGVTPATPAGGIHLPLRVAVWSAGGWLAGLTDSTALVESFFRNVAPGAEPVYATSVAIVVANTLLLTWFVVARRSAESSVRSGNPHRLCAKRLAVATVCVVAVGLFVLLVRGGQVSLEGRHQQYGAFLCIPLLGDWLFDGARARGRVVQILAVTCAGVFFAIPAGYGASALVDKVFVRTPRLRSAVGPDGIRIDTFARGDGAVGFYERMRALPDFDRALLVTDSPALSIMFRHQRTLILPGDEVDLPWRQAVRPPIDLHGLPAGPVALLTSRQTEQKRGPEVRRAFRDIRNWEEVRLPASPNVVLWLGRSR